MAEMERALRVCVLGHVDRHPEEAVRVITRELAASVGRAHRSSLHAVNRLGSFFEVRRSRPDIIHLVLSPTAGGLLAARVHALLNPRATVVVSAPHPAPSAFARWTILVRPDLVLAQAEQSEARFRRLGHRVVFFPNGVDLDRFRPAGKSQKARLREKYGVGPEFIVLHVGPVKRTRNLEMLEHLSGEGRKVLVVGRPTDPRDKSLHDALRGDGVIVWERHFAAIEEIICFADCYVFPTVDQAQSVEMPLSVLEAMACNLPVVSTPFGALPRVAEEGDGLWYAASEDKFLDAVRLIQENRMRSRTRDRVLGLSWDVLADRLAEIYRQAIAQKRAQHRTRKGPLPRQ